MSKGKEKAQRFGGLAAIRQPDPPPAETASDAVAPRPEDNPLRPFSSHLTATTKRRLKQAAAREGRSQFETLEQAVLEYLQANHADMP